MNVPPTPTSPKAKLQRRKSESSDSVEQLYSDPEMQKLHQPQRQRYGVFIILALLVGGAGGFAGGMLADQYGWMGSQNDATTNTTQQREDATIARELVQTLERTSRSLLAIYEERAVSGDVIADAYPQEAQRGSAVLLTDDGWAASTATVLEEGRTYVAVTNERSVLAVEQRTQDPATGIVFFRVDGTNHSVIPMEENGGALPTTVTYALAAANEGDTVRARTLTLTDTHTRPEGTLRSSESLTPTLTLSGRLPDDFRGGPVVDENGRALGLVEQAASWTESRAWTMRAIRQVLATLLRTDTVTRPLLGVHYIDIAATPGVPESVRFGRSKGALLTGDGDHPAILESSPAAKAKFSSGMLIVAVGSQSVDEQHSLSELLQEHEPGDAVELTVVDGTTERTTTIVLGTKTP